MSSAIRFNLDQSKILSSGNGLKDPSQDDELVDIVHRIEALTAPSHPPHASGSQMYKEDVKINTWGIIVQPFTKRQNLGPNEIRSSYRRQI